MTVFSCGQRDCLTDLLADMLLKARISYCLKESSRHRIAGKCLGLRVPSAKWSANFRDLNACITRRATLASGGCITTEVLAGELGRLRHLWSGPYGMTTMTSRC